jgi:spermidine synthase
LGLGGGTAAKLVRKYWPESKITGVDIDPVIVELGRKYLSLESASIYSIVEDAYDFVQKGKKKYDLILVDLYLGDKYPERFEEIKFVENVKKLLNKDGVAIFNRLYGVSDRGESMKFGKKLEKVFKKIEYIYPQANMIFVCYTREANI